MKQKNELNLNKKLFLSFEILLNIVFVLSLLFIFVYIIWCNDYNNKISLINEPEIKKVKKYINWKYNYPISFTLVYLSYFMIQITKFAILYKNRNGWLRSLFSMFFINKIQFINENKKTNKINFISSFVILNIALVSIIISIAFNIFADALKFSLIVLFIYLITIFLIYIPLIIYFKNKKYIN
ncbi:hypothetical protein [Mycoplasma struthionis]|uniref:Uncharacterized protein n=1 Tax=Mycoplasma struthionis TaxID=538220 RepID=A0A3G8LJ24_9MOLU|nr:hypothetical protein [Mycoplasma struthionis]AZG68882.1 hypothetical protein EGN60_02920 [Mycoplasma struthionis]